MATFGEMFQDLMGGQGVALYLLPFIIIFVVIYGLLDKGALFTRDKNNKPKGVYVAISLAVALLGDVAIYVSFNSSLASSVGLKGVVGVHTVRAFESAIPTVLVYIIAVAFLLILLGGFGLGREWLHAKIPGLDISIDGILAWLSIAIVAWIFIDRAWGTVVKSTGFTLPEEFKTIILPILVFGIIVWFVTRPEPKHSDNSSTSSEE